MNGTVTVTVAPASDEVLAKQVQWDGDEAAFRHLYRRHTPRLYAFVLRLLGGNESDADDLVQETWIRAVEGLEQFRWESSFSTWLTGIALNLCRKRVRQHDRQWMTLREEFDDPVDPPRVLERIDLERALRKLAPGYRTVVVLHDVEGWTHAEIAERLNISVNTSKSQLLRARRALRVELTSDTTRSKHE